MSKKKTEEELNNEKFDLALQEYKLELKLIYGKSQDAFEKQLSYLSAGALGFSMLFIEKVVGEISSSKSSWAVLVSWLFLTITLTVNLISHWLAARNTSKSIKEIDENNYESSKVTKRIKTITFINVGTIITFFLGIILLLTFVTINIMNKNSKPVNSAQQKGQVPTSAPQRPAPSTGQVPSSPPVKPPVKSK